MSARQALADLRALCGPDVPEDANSYELAALAPWEGLCRLAAGMPHLAEETVRTAREDFSSFGWDTEEDEEDSGFEEVERPLAEVAREALGIEEPIAWADLCTALAEVDGSAEVKVMVETTDFEGWGTEPDTTTLAQLLRGEVGAALFGHL